MSSKFGTGTQSGGAVNILLNNPYPTTVVIDAETDAISSSGVLSISFRTVGMKKFKPLINPETNSVVTINMSSPYPLVFDDVVFEELQFTPSGFGGGETFSMSIHSKV